MTLQELSHTFSKAHILMGTGVITGELIANSRGMSCSWLFGLLMGILLSLHLYNKCVIALFNEYKRLKARNGNENLS